MLIRASPIPILSLPLSSLLRCFVDLPTERILMTKLTVPDEETPLLAGQQVATTGRALEPESEVATSLSNQNNPAPGDKGTANAHGVSNAVKKTPLPWGQLAIVLVLELAEPLTSQVISPVSSSVRFPSHLSLWRPLTPGCGIQLRAK